MPPGILLGMTILASACASTQTEPAPTTYAKMPPWSFVGTPVPSFWWYKTIQAKPLHDPPNNFSGKTRIVAVLDTGFLIGHEAVEPSRVGAGTGWCPGGDFGDINGHGTQLAGIAVGKDSYASGDESATGGMAPNATLLPVKVVCGVSNTDRVIAGIQFAVDQGADVILLALGGWPSDQDIHQIILDKLKDPKNRWSSVLFVVASAWDDQAYQRPEWTKQDNVLVVAAMTLDNTKSEIVYSDMSGDIWAPGRDIETASIEGGAGKHAQFLMQGTSPAAAIVAGCAAAVKKGNEAPVSLKNRLVSRALKTLPKGQPRLDCLLAAP